MVCYAHLQWSIRKLVNFQLTYLYELKYRKIKTKTQK